MIHGTAKTHVYIGAAHAETLDLSGYEAEDWVEINGIEDLGEFGAEGQQSTIALVGEDYVRRRKGAIDSGTVALVCARDATDPGQNVARRAAGTEDRPVAFKVVLNDAPSDTGTPTIFYFQAIVYSGRNQLGGANDITKIAFALGIDGEILEEPATVLIAVSPAAGALPAGVHNSAYAGVTITATGGIGTVSYAVTAGALPAGLTLNPATGVISGTPTAAGSNSFTVTATYTGSGRKSVAYTLDVT